MKKNKERIKKFLEILERVPIVTKACNECGLSRNTIHRWRNEDDKFREKMDKAMIMGNKAMDDLANAKHYSLMNKDHWPSIKYRLMHSPTVKEQTMLEKHDKTVLELRSILNYWRDGNIEKREAEEQSKKLSRTSFLCHN